MNFSVIAAVNNEAVLQQCLLRSPDLQIQNGAEILLQRGFENAADAFNAAIEQAKGEVLVFIHQDIYLPAGWFQQVTSAINALAPADPDWGVLGVYGVTVVGEMRGHLYCNANQGELGQSIPAAMEVGTLDEIVLIIRKNSGLKFDRELKGFHLYGTDICLMARGQGKKNYVVPGFCIHNANGYGMFPASFWRGYLHLRRKWKSLLPVKTPCIEIKRSLWPVWRSTLWRFCWLKAKRIKLARRMADPARFYDKRKANAASKMPAH